MRDLSIRELGNFSPRQDAALDAMYTHPEPVLLYGGAGGGGKSHFLRFAAFWHTYNAATVAQRPVRTILACQTYRELTDRHIGRLSEDFRAFGTVKTSQTFGMAFHFRNENIGAILLRNLDDPDKYRGSECVGAFIDEASVLQPQRGNDHILDLLRYPIRAGFETPSLPLVLASNPDGPGFGWLKRCFVTRTDLLGMDADQVHFVPALVDDNPNDYARETLKRKLGQLQPHLRRARLLGLWDAPEGARFPSLGEHNDFQQQVKWPHGIPKNLTRIVGVDWGSADPYCALWHVIEPQIGFINVYTYREDYERGLLTRDQAERVAGMTGVDERIERIYADPSMWSRATSTITGTLPISAADVYENVLESDPRFGSFERGVWMQTSRIHGLNALGEYLSHKGLIRWHIDRIACPNLWREMEQATFAKSASGSWSEDMSKNQPDHAVTAAIYSLHTHLRGMEESEPKPELTIYDHIIANARKARPKPRF